MWDILKCNLCGDCFVRCQYLNYDRDKIDRHNNVYNALCFQPININADNKLDIESTKLALKKFVLWRKWSG